MRLLPETWQKSLQEMRAPRCKYSKPQKGQAYTDYCAQYCSEECQKDHWYKIHKADCNSAIAKPPWEPDWVAERRKPAFSGDRVAPYALFGSKKYLWGNLPPSTYSSCVLMKASDTASLSICCSQVGSFRPRCEDRTAAKKFLRQETCAIW